MTWRQALNNSMVWRRALTGSSVAVSHRQLYMMPTRMGYVFSLLLFALLLSAINYEIGLSYALTFFLAAVGQVSMLYTHRNLLGIRVMAGAAPPVFAGQNARFTICVRNDAAKHRHRIELHYKKEIFAIIDLGPHDQKHVVLEIPAASRGMLPIEEIVLKTRFPLGLLYTWSSRIKLDQSCLVYPKPAIADALPMARAGNDVVDRGQTNRGDDFVGLREYQHGDSPKHVHWKALARGQGMQTKQFGGGGGEDLWLDWNDAGEIDTEERLSRLCRWVISAEDLGLNYGLRLPNKEIRPDSGRDHESHCLRTLALYKINE